MQLIALHIILKWMRFSFFESFPCAVAIANLCLFSLLFVFSYNYHTLLQDGGWVGELVGLGGFGWVGLGGFGRVYN